VRGAAPKTRALWIASAALLAAARALPAAAHDARPAYLEVREDESGRQHVTWKLPVLGDRVLPVEPRFPAGCRTLVAPAAREVPGALLVRSILECGPGGLRGERIDFAGLEATLADVLVRVSTPDGAVATTLVRRAQPWLEVAPDRGAAAIAGAYLAHGVEHILGGFDHLLFVLGLMWIVRGVGRLVKTITAFTVAHSITLALATLGVVRLPGPPVEASIALSILLLAVEIARMDRGEPSLTLRFPWAVAFSFGLLHGFGFAGALAELGLPSADIPLALLAFNAGVEVGQLAVVACFLAAAWLLSRLRVAWPAWARAAPAYAFGSLAAYWFFDRIAGFAR
jgi:hydrogenase/urease accessory protein HupE